MADHSPQRLQVERAEDANRSCLRVPPSVLESWPGHPPLEVPFLQERRIRCLTEVKYTSYSFNSSKPEDEPKHAATSITPSIRVLCACVIFNRRVVGGSSCTSSAPRLQTDEHRELRDHVECCLTCKRIHLYSQVFLDSPRLEKRHGFKFTKALTSLEGVPVQSSEKPPASASLAVVK